MIAINTNTDLVSMKKLKLVSTKSKNSLMHSSNNNLLFSEHTDKF